MGDGKFEKGNSREGREMPRGVGFGGGQSVRTHTEERKRGYVEAAVAKIVWMVEESAREGEEEKIRKLMEEKDKEGFFGKYGEPHERFDFGGPGILRLGRSEGVEADVLQILLEEVWRCACKRQE